VDTAKEFDWRRSSRCESGGCVEVRHTDGVYEVRDSKHPDGPTLRFLQSEWDAFLRGVRDGEFG